MDSDSADIFVVPHLPVCSILLLAIVYYRLVKKLIKFVEFGYKNLVALRTIYSNFLSGNLFKDLGT